MVKKKSGMGRRRKKSNSTNEGAKRSKTEDEEKNLAQYRDGLLHGIRALLGKMEEKDLVAIMMYIGSMEGAGEKQKTTTSAQPPAVGSVTATAREEAIAITNITFNPSESPPTTEQAPANPTTSSATTTTTTTTTTVPPSPQEQQPTK